jgi:hypothetical protein
MASQFIGHPLRGLWWLRLTVASQAFALRACLKTCPVRPPGLRDEGFSLKSCRPRARRPGGIFKQAHPIVPYSVYIGLPRASQGRLLQPKYSLTKTSPNP